MGTIWGQSPLATCRSEWQTPQAWTSISTSCAPGAGRATSSILSCSLNSFRMAAFIASTSNKLGCVTQFSADGLRRINVSLRFGSPQEEFDCISHSLGESIRSGKIYGPLTHDGIEKSFHKFGEVNHRKIAGNLAIFLAFSNDFTEQADSCGFRASQLRRTDLVHRTGKNYSLPERSSHFGHIS